MAQVPELAEAWRHMPAEKHGALGREREQQHGGLLQPPSQYAWLPALSRVENMAGFAAESCSLSMAP